MWRRPPEVELTESPRRLVQLLRPGSGEDEQPQMRRRAYGSPLSRRVRFEAGDLLGFDHLEKFWLLNRNHVRPHIRRYRVASFDRSRVCRFFVSLVLLSVVPTCRGRDSASDSKPNEVQMLALAASPVSVVAILKGRPNSPVAAGIATGFDPAAGGGFKPRFAAGDVAVEPVLARVTLPGTATAALHLEDAATNVAVDVSLKGASAVAAQAADGDLVYPNAVASGGTVLHRPIPAGTEDFVAFDAKPSTTQVAYDLKLGAGAAGLRLVGGALEVLDSNGAPRLRVSPPYIVGADGVAASATLAVGGCAVDVIRPRRGGAW